MSNVSAELIRCGLLTTTGWHCGGKAGKIITHVAQCLLVLWACAVWCCASVHLCMINQARSSGLLSCYSCP
jgi:hypothetical protein